MSDKKIIVVKDKKYTTYAFSEETMRTISKKMRSKCFDCNCVFNGSCSKVTDTVKKPINQYPFILEGYQVVDSFGNIETLSVSKCSNIVIDNEENLAKARESLTLEPKKMTIDPVKRAFEESRSFDLTRRRSTRRGHKHYVS